jgi:excinuclease UvrABC nuclease subunit
MRLQFVEKSVQAVPEQPGIYTLWDERHPVYIGRTAPRSNLRAEIDHALTMAMVEDLSATHFSFEVTQSPKTRAAEELRTHFERWGSLPRYNERNPSRDLQQPQAKDPVAARR